MDSGKILRLILFTDCKRNCKYCANKQHDIYSLPITSSFSGYKMILLTGGEPLLRIKDTLNILFKVRSQTKAPVFLYTALPEMIPRIALHVDGLTVTLHDVASVHKFKVANKELLKAESVMAQKSLKINLFNEYKELDDIDLRLWTIKKKVWHKECVTSKDEVLMRSVLCVQ